MRAATRGATVTRQLAVGGQQPIDRIAVDVNAIITTLEASLRRVAGPMATCTFDLEPSLPDVEGDSKQIEQVLLHLAGNAGDAIGDEGAITITTSSTISEDVRARNHPEIDPREYVWLTVGAITVSAWTHEPGNNCSNRIHSQVCRLQCGARAARRIRHRQSTRRRDRC